ncbi:T9SS type A sorting domain-containing protein [candidate division KSB1 bacterium]|nr:T9SS type A sorting domain-containing protein [candidate division KSB1 bacterium]
MNKRACIFAALFLTIIVSIYAQEHPFLIVSESEFATLRTKSSTAPWSEIKSKATSDAAVTISNGADFRKIANKVSAAALLYILNEDEGQRTNNINIIIQTINLYDTDALGPNWSGFVYPGTAFFNCVLAYDVVYNGMTESQRNTAHTKLEQIGDWYMNNTGYGWSLSLYSARGIWSLLEGNTSGINTNSTNYVNYLKTLFTPNGLFTEGTGYCWDRLGADYKRDHKSCFLDVLEYTGTKTGLYDDPLIISYYEWLYTALSPFKRVLPFGDATPEFRVNGNYNGPALYRAAKFSTLAGQNAGWITTSITGSTLLTYILHEEFPTAVPPQSSYNPDGYAGFWEQAEQVTQNSLMGALWSCIESGWHSHKETNSIYIAGFGEHLIRNSGYNGASQGLLGFSWNDIHANALYGNTVLINDANHTGIIGGGIDEAFFSSTMDYASSLSGHALGNNDHTRNFVFVKPTSVNNGYFLLFDEVKAANASHNASVSLHPNADNCVAVTEDQEYHSQIQEFTTGADVNIFLATAPIDVEILEGPIGNGTGGYSNGFVGKFLYPTYDTDAFGERNILTALFPYKPGVTKPTAARLAGVTNGTGVEIKHSAEVLDYAVVQESDTVSFFGSVLFNGKAVLYRTVSGSLNFYLARKATSFAYGNDVGFTSTLPVSVFLEDANGKIVSPGTEVTFFAEGITGVTFNGSPLTPTTTTDNSVTVTIPSGTHDIILDGVTHVIAPADVLPEHYKLNQNYPNPFNPATTIEYELAKSEKVTIRIYNVLGNEIVTLVNDCAMNAGSHSISWNGADHSGRIVGAGVYIYNILAGSFIESRKMLSLK